MAYRFTARSTTPGEYRWVTGFFGGIVDSGNVISGIDRGDGILGIYDSPSINDVRDNVVYGNDAYTGILNLPSINDVLDDVIFDNNTKTGILGLPSVENVRSAITFGVNNTEYTGLIVLPSEKDVRFGVAYDIIGTIAALEGKLVLPSVTDVEQGILYGNLSEYTGILNLPSIGDVRYGITYNNATQTGSLLLPSINDVNSGVLYGSGSVEFTGVYKDAIVEADIVAATDVRYGVARYVGGDSGIAYIPTAANVISGVNVDNTVGIFVVPSVNAVLEDTFFGANNTQYTGTVVLPSAGDVRQGITFGPP